MLLLCFAVMMLIATSDDSVPTMPLGKGLHMPVLGLGTAGLGNAGESIIYNALMMGAKMIDTAQASEWYSEKDTGNALRRYATATNSTPDVLIVTKIHPKYYHKEKLYSRFLESKSYLSLRAENPLDVVLLHSPTCWRGLCTEEENRYKWQDAWKILEELKKNGEIIAIGVSNFEVQQLQELSQISNSKISVVQNWMDPFHQDIEVRKFCNENGIIYMAYSSFGTQWQGRWPGNVVWDNPVLQEISLKHEKEISQVVISWLLQEGVVAIPRSSKLEHLSINLHYETFLDNIDLDRIRSLDGILD